MLFICNKLTASLVAVLVCILPLCLCDVEKTDHGAASHKSDHYKNGVHNAVFDMQALLAHMKSQRALWIEESQNNDSSVGSDNVGELEDLPEEVRHRRLKTLAKSHDLNNDDNIDEQELKEWIMQSFNIVDREEANERMHEDDGNEDGMLTFAEIVDKQYGYKEGDMKDLEAAEEGHEDHDMWKVISEDKRRFDAADLNKDGILEEEEFMAYFLPYNYAHMFPLEMERAMKELDKDNDGHVSMEEFIGDQQDEEHRQAELSQFEELDGDKDGKLSPEELRPWALADNHEIAKEEVEHLYMECDTDQDGKLTIDEIVRKEEEFMSSSATDYGRIVHFVRDEL